MKKKYSAVSLFGFLLLFWLILGADLTLVQALIGTLASFLVVWFNYDLVFNHQETSKLTFRLIGRFFRLAVVLVVAIVKANFHVAAIVLSPRMKIQPGFRKIRNPLRKDLNQALYANAITLTPGTLTVDLDDQGILVHGLETNSVSSLENSSLERAFVLLEAE